MARHFCASREPALATTTDAAPRTESNRITSVLAARPGIEVTSSVKPRRPLFFHPGVEAQVHQRLQHLERFTYHG